jgi:hypothetical protein
MTRSGARVVPALGALRLLAPLAATAQPPASLDGVGSGPAVHGLGAIANHHSSGLHEDLKLEGK